MANPSKTQDPLDLRKLTVDFSLWLAGSTISSAAWVMPTGLTQSDASETSTAAINYFAATGVQNNKEYEVAVTITTADTIARKKTQRFVLVIESGF